MHFRADGRRVDVEDARVHLVHRAEGSVNVGRVYRGRKAVAHTVANLHGLFQRTGGDDGRDGAEYLLLRDTHVGRGVREDCRLDEVAVCVRAFVQTIATASELRAV